MGQKCMSTNGQEQLLWEVERLWELAEDLPVEMVPLQEFAEFYDSKCWFGPEGLTFRHLADRARAVIDADLSYPIILSAEGWVMDGRTRLCKALIDGRHEIAVVRFRETPEPDERVVKHEAQPSHAPQP